MPDLLDVLVVEDDTISAHALCTLLSQVGMSVEAAATVAARAEKIDKVARMIPPRGDYVSVWRPGNSGRGLIVEAGPNPSKAN